MRIAIGIILFFVFTGCSFPHWDSIYPYSKVNPTAIKKQAPINFEECLAYLDLIMKDEAKNYFKNQDSSIAVIEISKSLGGFLINNWNLNVYGQTKWTTSQREVIFSNTLPPKVLDLFFSNGIKDPNAMTRIIFACYYKKLNNRNYNWNHEIGSLKSYWVNPKIIYYYPGLSDKMRIREDSIMSAFELRYLELNDTVVCFLRGPHRIFSKDPDEYYLTGIVNAKKINSCIIRDCLNFVSSFARRALMSIEINFIPLFCP